MPMPPGALDLMRSHPQRSDTYLIIQQPVTRPASGDPYAGYDWSCRIDGDPSGDPVATLTVDAGMAGAIDLLDGMTVAIGSEYGTWDKALIRLRGDQTVGAATTTLDIATSSDIVGNVVDNDYVTVWDEFRLWQRYGRITVAGDVVTWYKDYDILWANLAPNDAFRRVAAMPPLPIMGPHAVRFMEVGGSASVDFDWSDSHANAPGEAITDWDSWGETDHVGGTWNDTVENPSPKTYTNVSGLAGFRTVLEVATGPWDSVTTVGVRRGVRYVFTVRRPGQTQGGDPANSEPITSFELSAVSSSYGQGYARTSITVFEDQAHDYMIIPGALVIVFTEDWYAGEVTYLSQHGANVEVGPIRDRENIMFIGRIADGSISIDSETQAVSFDVISIGEEASRYENYPIVIENDAEADDWIQTPSLTIQRAIWHYIAWHTTLSLVTDVYLTDDDLEIKAMDFMAGSIYSTIDSFLQSRLFARLLFDRYSRAICETDVQMDTYGTVPTLWVLDNDDWLETMAITEASLAKTNYVELGGIEFTVGKITPYMSGAPGQFDKYRGSPTSSMALAIADQDDLNVLSGRLLAYRNNDRPSTRLALAGNWRICDIVPQEAIYFDNVQTVRGVLDGRFIVREWTRTYESAAGAWFTSVMVEKETDGPPGQTIEIPDSFPPIPVIPHPRLPVPPGKPPSEGGGGATDIGRRMITTNVGVFVTDGISAASPYWYAINDGLDTDDDKIAWSIRRDPHHWWTTKGEEKRLWVGTKTGIWYMDDFPGGTWINHISLADLTAAGAPTYDILYTRMNYSIEEDEIYAFCYYSPGGIGLEKYVYVVVESGAISNIFCPWPCGGNYHVYHGWPDMKFASHSGSNVLYASRPPHDPGSVSNLYKSINRGASWSASISTARKGHSTSISIPYVDPSNADMYVLWGIGPGLDSAHNISEDAGVTFATLDTSPDADGYCKIGTGGHPNYIFLLGRTPKWSNDKGVTWTELPHTGYAGGVHPYSASHAIWNAGTLQEVLVGGSDGTVLYWAQGLSAWQDKTGNLAAYGVTDVRDIDRDSMGVA